jgi:hypothetical protein
VALEQGTAALQQLRGEVQQLQEQLTAKEGEAKAAVHDAELATAAVAAKLLAATTQFQLQLEEAQAAASLQAATAQSLAAATAENAGLRAEVREWLVELKSSRAAEEGLSEQVQLLQQRVAELWDET